MMLLTIKEVADLYRVNYRTVLRWIAKGAVTVMKTPGGGIRIKIDRGMRHRRTSADISSPTL